MLKNIILFISLVFFITIKSGFSQSMVDCLNKDRDPDLPSKTELDHPDKNLKEGLTELKTKSNGEFSFRHPHLNNLRIETIKYASEQTVFAAGQLGMVLKSMDGGKTWEELETPFNERITALDVRSEEKVVVAGHNGLVAISNNGGVLWEITETNTNTVLRDIVFKEENSIIASGNEKTIIKSEDGGNTWISLQIPEDLISNPHNKDNWSYLGITVTSDAMFVGVDGTGMPFQILKSEDGGQVWEKSLPSGVPTPPSNQGFGVTAISFSGDGQTGYASYRRALSGGVVRTTDGGGSWDRVDEIFDFDPLPNEEVPYVSTLVQVRRNIVVSADGQTILAGGLFGQVLCSVDGGDNWYELYGGVRQGDRDFAGVNFPGVDISPDGNSWLVGGSRGIIAGDSGFSPAEATVRNGEELVLTFIDGTFIDNELGYISGFQTVEKYLNEDGDIGAFAVGAFMKTTDGGSSWERIEGPGKVNYRWYGVESTPNGKVWAIGMTLKQNQIIGTIAYSEDSGETWNEQYSLDGQEIASITKYDENNLYAVTFGNKLLISKDGLQWGEVTVPPPATAGNILNAVEAVAPGVVFVGGGNVFAGGQGFLFKTKNSGNSWELVFDSGNRPGRISDIQFIDGRFGYASGSWGPTLNRTQLLYSDNFGNDWQPVEGTFDGANNAELLFIAMADSINAKVFGASGQAVIAGDSEDFYPILPRFSESHIRGGTQIDVNNFFLFGDQAAILQYESEEAINNVPIKFTNLSPYTNDTLDLGVEPVPFYWSPSMDPDGGDIYYELIIENTQGTEEFYRFSAGEENTYELNAADLHLLSADYYHWRIEAFDDAGYYSSTYPSINYFIIEELSSDATLSQLFVEGEPISGFDPNTYHYHYLLDPGTTSAPEVTAEANHPNATYEVFPADDVTSPNQQDRRTEIVVTAEDTQSTVSYYVLFDVETSVFDPNFPNMAELFPNPVKDQLTIRTGWDKNTEFFVFGPRGAVLLNGVITNSEKTIDVSGLKAGQYVLKLYNKRKTLTKQFIVIK